jgi:hypothetical protein
VLTDVRTVDVRGIACKYPISLAPASCARIEVARQIVLQNKTHPGHWLRFYAPFCDLSASASALRIGTPLLLLLLANTTTTIETGAPPDEINRN